MVGHQVPRLPEEDLASIERLWLAYRWAAPRESPRGAGRERAGRGRKAGRRPCTPLAKRASLRAPYRSGGKFGYSVQRKIFGTKKVGANFDRLFEKIGAAEPAAQICGAQ